MTNRVIAQRRLHSQQLIEAAVETPAALVRWMGAVQAQDYLGAKWAVAQRINVVDSAVHQAISDGSVLRLHVLRPTWHFVAAEDARWLLALTGPRVIRSMASRYRELALDDRTFERSHAVIQQALSGGRQLTRIELETAFQEAGIATDIPQRMGHILMHAELDRLLCSGAWKGKQPTYALLDERVPPVQPFDREWALRELAQRFFTSHGPATLKDYAWWSGLTLTEGRAGIELAGDRLTREEIDGKTYWSADAGTNLAIQDTAVHLLPNYDEFVVAYTDRSAIFDLALSDKLHMRGGVLNNVIVINGLVAGGWKREFKKNEVRVTAQQLWSFSEPEIKALEQAAQRYGSYLSLPATLHVQG